MIEAKTSRSDLLSKKQKRIYERSLIGFTLYDFHYIIVAKDFVILPTDYPRWGIIKDGKVVRRTKRILKDGLQAKVNLIEKIALRNTMRLYKNIFFPSTQLLTVNDSLPLTSRTELESLTERFK